MWKAALAWCDGALVQNLVCCHEAYRDASRGGGSENPFPTAADGRRVRFIALGEGGIEVEASRKRQAAVENIEADFRERIGSRKIFLSGLRSAPIPENARTAIPVDWASFLIFDWEHSAVTAFKVTFVGVTGRAVGVQPRQPIKSVPDEQLECTDRQSRKPPGRASYLPMISEALKAFAQEKGKMPAEILAAADNSSGLARSLETKLRKMHPTVDQSRLPSVETIRKHVRELAAPQMVEKGGR
ncbi:hypothetical protein E2C06_20075 [Dankookia rubra]|uniref:Uncharacterized protein n=1 Tax=Dankookia rubra TaxID=1442381 RepID=A0A4R5QDT4_9PROT|nr:hypothetical protein [Dankookia rubra]TDH60798.1 hypothetical protein E2C06_20075 [Dankookia rubra]